MSDEEARLRSELEAARAQLSRVKAALEGTPGNVRFLSPCLKSIAADGELTIHDNNRKHIARQILKRLRERCGFLDEERKGEQG